MNLPSIRKNYIYRLLYDLLVLIIPFVTTPYISRVLGADGIDIYSYTASVITYFTLFSALGTNSYGARESAQHRDEPTQTSRLFWEIELMTVGTSSVCLAAWIIFIIFSKEYHYYYMALIPLLFATMVDISLFLTGYEQVKYIVNRNIICKLVGIFILMTQISVDVCVNSVVLLILNDSMYMELI